MMEGGKDSPSSLNLAPTNNSWEPNWKTEDYELKVSGERGDVGKEGTLVQTQIIDIDPNYPLLQNLHTD
jgi:hypothetical protein